MVASALLKNTAFIKEWLVATIFVKKEKDGTPKKNGSLQLNIVLYKEKTYSLFFRSLLIAQIQYTISKQGQGCEEIPR